MQVCNRSVFSNNLYRDRIVTVREVRENMDATIFLKRQDKVQYFASVGIEYDNVERYIHVVERLNKVMDEPTSATSMHVQDPTAPTAHGHLLATSIQRMVAGILFCISFTMHDFID